MIQLVKMELLRMSLVGGSMILIICLLRTALKRHISMRMRMLFWYMAFIRLLSPFSVRLLVLSERTELKEAGGLQRVLLEMSEPIAAMAERGTQPGVTGFPEKSEMIHLLWLAGMAAVALYFLICYIRCRKSFAQALPLSDNWKGWKDFPDMCRHTAGRWRRVELRSHDRISSPLTYGIGKPVILLPKDMVEACEDGEEKEEALRFILFHELVHIQRLDCLTKLLLTSALAIYWFHPAVWLMYFLANRDIELCCDEIVLQRLGEDKRGFYAMTLLSVEEQRGDRAALYPGFGKNILEERIKRIMEKKKMTRFGKIAGGLAVVAVCLIFGVTVQSKVAEASAHPAAVLHGQHHGDEEHAHTEHAHTRHGAAGGTGEVLLAEEQVQSQTKSGAEIPKEKPELCWPLADCYRVTSTCGERVHPITGEVTVSDHITVTGEAGKEWESAEICAAAGGVVTETGFDAEKGNYIILSHADGLCTEYTHCKEIRVEKAMQISQGAVIGTMGKTGQATGACLGFYVYENGKAKNPLDYYEILFTEE